MAADVQLCCAAINSMAMRLRLQPPKRVYTSKHLVCSVQVRDLEAPALRQHVPLSEPAAAQALDPVAPAPHPPEAAPAHPAMVLEDAALPALDVDEDSSVGDANGAHVDHSMHLARASQSPPSAVPELRSLAVASAPLPALCSPPRAVLEDAGVNFDVNGTALWPPCSADESEAGADANAIGGCSSQDKLQESAAHLEPSDNSTAVFGMHDEDDSLSVLLFSCVTVLSFYELDFALLVSATHVL